MSKRIIFTQSIWAMERRDPDGAERSAEENLDMIPAAGFDGISGPCAEAAAADALAGAAAARGLAAQAEWQCFPKTVDDLKRFSISRRNGAVITSACSPTSGHAASKIACRCSRAG